MVRRSEDLGKKSLAIGVAQLALVLGTPGPPGDPGTGPGDPGTDPGVPGTNPGVPGTSPAVPGTISEVPGSGLGVPRTGASCATPIVVIYRHTDRLQDPECTPAVYTLFKHKSNTLSMDPGAPPSDRLQRLVPQPRASPSDRLAVQL